MDSPFFEIPSGSFMISPFEVDIPERYLKKKDFPNCCKAHSRTFANINEWFDRFPNCCVSHQELAQKWWFKKSTYNGIATKVMNCVSYSLHHIAEHIEDVDWFKDITDYIEYILHSFGTPAIGSDKYLACLDAELVALQSVEQAIINEKVDQIIEYIRSQTILKKSVKTDINSVYHTYQKWLKAFPFELFPFTRIKGHFFNQLPLIKGKIEFNPYLGLAKGKPHTPSMLINFLCNLTKKASNYKSEIRPALKGSFLDRISSLLKINFDLLPNIEVDALKKNFKRVTFRLGQTISLLDGIEIYTKKDFKMHHPDLASIIDRSALPFPGQIEEKIKLFFEKISILDIKQLEGKKVILNQYRANYDTEIPVT